MMLSLFSLILIAAVVIGLGMGGLALLSLVINALTGRGKVNPTEKVGAWSGLKSALGISAALVAITLVVGAMLILQFRRLIRTPADYEQANEIQSTLNDAETTRQSILGDSKEASGPEKPRIKVDSEAADRSTVPVDVDSSDTPTSQSNLAHDEPSSVIAIADSPSTDAADTAVAEHRKVQLEEMIAGIGEFLRSQLEKVGDKSTATAFGQAAKSDNGDVVIFQPSDEMVQQMLGAGGQDLLKSFNSELPGRIRQTYALIPLTTPVGSAVPMEPMIAARGLEMIANSIVRLVENADSASSNATPESVAMTAEADGTLTVAPEIRQEPEWITKPDGRRIVAKSKPVMFGDDGDILMTTAINVALAKHIETVTASMNPAWQSPRVVHMQLSPSMASKYIVDEYERPETLETEVEGVEPFQIRYALLEFPEAIDQIAVRQFRHAVQKDRIIGLGIVVGLMWLSVCSAGFGVRQWQKGTNLRRIAATPVFAVITIPTLLLTVVMVFALAKGDMPQGPWNDTPVTIDLANM